MAERSPDDPRDRVVTISMTAEQWDSGHFTWYYSSYARDSHSAARQIFVDATEPGYEERRALARAEFEAERPPLTPAAKRALTRKVKTLLRKHRAGTLRVDHLGRGPDDGPDLISRHGWDVSIIPSTVGGDPAFHFAMDERSFEGRSDRMGEADVQWLIALAKRVTGAPEVRAWNLPPTTWVSVAFPVTAHG